MAGRGGMGAVMGSKNLKAIAVKGSGRPAYHDPTGLRKAVKEANPWIRDNSISLAKFGTAGGLVRAENSGDLPIKNWLEGSWNEGAEAISGQRIMETVFAGHYRCFACPIGCGKDVHLKEGPYAGLEGHGPEYETLGSFGSLLLNDDLGSIARVNDLCNRHGLDTISAGAVVALAMEAYERGLLTRKDTGGLELGWGRSDAIVALVEMIAQREGLGDLLAAGVKVAAQRLGPGAEDLAIHTKGLEIPMHDPRAFLSMAVNYATANRGGCHLEAPAYWYDYGIKWEDWGSDWEPNCHIERDKAREARDFQDYISLYNPLGVCKFIARAGVGPSHLTSWIRLALGWDIGKEELLLVGERLFNLKRLVNLRLGTTAKDDTLPLRLLTHARPSGKAAGVLPNLGAMLKEYYALRGWAPEGIPGEARLAALGLSDL
jgi:aldehyde:ferredoxin oxidoreductase